MGKSKTNWRKEEHYGEDEYVSKRDIMKYKNHRKEKRLNSALHSKDLDYLMDDSEED